MVVKQEKKVEAEWPRIVQFRLKLKLKKIGVEAEF